MFEILVYKNNNPETKMFLIPPSKGYNIETWILVTIKGKEQFLMQRYIGIPDNICLEDWEIKKNYAFPSALLSEFLRLDFNDPNLTTILSSFEKKK